ncbi:hypothetical protein PCE1_000344 [Barthelona sp. PCE]
MSQDTVVEMETPNLDDTIASLEKNGNSILSNLESIYSIVSRKNEEIVATIEERQSQMNNRFTQIAQYINMCIEDCNNKSQGINECTERIQSTQQLFSNMQAQFSQAIQ